jgi:hypothetical protein
LTIFETPQQNRVTERKNRKLIGQSWYKQIFLSLIKVMHY